MRLALSEKSHRHGLFAFVEIDADALRAGADSGAATKIAPSDAAPAFNVDSDDDDDEQSMPADNSHPAVRIYTEGVSHGEIGRWLRESINDTAKSLRLQALGLNPAVVAA